MKRPAYSQAELKGMTPDQITGIAGPDLCGKVMKQTQKQFASDQKRKDGESQGEFLQRRRSAGKVDAVEFPKAARANLEAAIYNSEGNQGQLKADKMFGAMRSTPEEKQALAERMAARENQHRMADLEGGRAFTSSPAAGIAGGWESGGATPAGQPPKTAPRGKGKKK